MRVTGIEGDVRFRLAVTKLGLRPAGVSPYLADTADDAHEILISTDREPGGVAPDRPCRSGLASRLLG
jgi:hypothetical protein